MSQQRTQQQLLPAFILHARPYRETSLLLELWVASRGRLSAVARSARGPKSRFRGHCQPFTPLMVRLTGRGELQSLAQLEVVAAGYLLSGMALWCGFYLNELLMRSLPRHDPHPVLYQTYHDTLIQLVSCPAATSHDAERREVLLRLFEKTLLTELGYGLILDKEGDHRTPIDPDVYYVVDPQQGPARAMQQSPSPRVFQGQSLLALAKGQLTTRQSLRDAKRLMRHALLMLIGDAPLKSRELFIGHGGVVDVET